MRERKWQTLRICTYYGTDSGCWNVHWRGYFIAPWTSGRDEACTMLASCRLLNPEQLTQTQYLVTQCVLYLIWYLPPKNKLRFKTRRSLYFPWIFESWYETTWMTSHKRNLNIQLQNVCIQGPRPRCRWWKCQKWEFKCSLNFKFGRRVRTLLPISNPALEYE